MRKVEGEEDVDSEEDVICIVPGKQAAEAPVQAESGASNLGVPEAAAAGAPMAALAPRLAVGGVQSMFLGTLDLPKFKALAEGVGLEARLFGGRVVCNDSVTVKKRKSASGDGFNEYVLEGMISPDYYKVRKLLYEQFTPKMSKKL